MQIILFMTLSGSLLFLMVNLIQFFKPNIFSLRQRHNMLKIALLLHFIPLPILIFFIKRIILRLFPSKTVSSFVYYGYEKLLFIGKDKIGGTDAFFNEFLVFGLWIFISFCVLLFQIWKRQKFRRLVLKASNKIIDYEILNIIDKYKTELGIKKNIFIYQTGADISPFTTGILKPIIVIPYINNKFQMRTAIYHELCHIKNNDGLILLLRVIMCCIYWFNPIVYFLSKSLENNCELICDEKVTHGMDRDDRLQYGYFIIDISTKKSNKKYASAFSNDKNIIKERLDFIMKPRKKSKKLTVAIAGALCLVSIFPAFAYEMPNVIYLETLSNNDILKSDKEFIKFTPNGQEQNNIKSELLHRSVFIADDGTIYNVSNETETQLFCNHSYVSGTYKEHIKNSKGGCTTHYYNAKICSKCNKIVLGDVTGQLTLVKCPH